ncbi:hypothetical protein [Vibrio diazotrophicus]|uniref:hypothetical protein n=1 Tax=Vibrio diazotrophicus TaxID=685 RepID=UPI000C9DDCA7|nr:hypothetical protein [Vibrio diazotrophicus]PNH89459.1 hypothetical protein C1M59_18315 [Vibrio diazotrophicus]
MLSSEIVVSKADIVLFEDQHNVKLRQAYLRERKVMEHIDIELNRAKIVIMDENGNILKFAMTLEH